MEYGIKWDKPFNRAIDAAGNDIVRIENADGRHRVSLGKYFLGSYRDKIDAEETLRVANHVLDLLSR